MTKSTFFGIRLPVSWIPQTVTAGFTRRINVFTHREGRVA